MEVSMIDACEENSYRSSKYEGTLGWEDPLEEERWGGGAQSPTAAALRVTGICPSLLASLSLPPLGSQGVWRMLPAPLEVFEGWGSMPL